MSDLQNLVAFIPAAVIISIIVFLVRFFGKVIADQVPFADDRKWLEEIGGVKFFTGYILSPLLWVFLWYSRGWRFWLFPKEDFWIFIISLVSIIIATVVKTKSSDFFINNDFDDGNLGLFIKKLAGFKDKLKLNKGDWMILLKFIFLSANTLFIAVLMFYFYEWHSYYHILVAIIYFFNHLILFAFLTSLNKRNILIANIEFIDRKRKPFNNCRIIKVNNDNAKVIYNKKGFIINKSLISTIEIISKKSKRKKKND